MIEGPLGEEGLETDLNLKMGRLIMGYRKEEGKGCACGLTEQEDWE